MFVHPVCSFIGAWLHCDMSIQCYVSSVQLVCCLSVLPIVPVFILEPIPNSKLVFSPQTMMRC